MHFALYCMDRDDAGTTRADTRPDHLAFVAGRDDVRIAGPLLADDGETMVGSLFVIEAADRSAVDAFNAADPYTRAGLWGSVTIHPFRWLAGSVPP